MRRHEADAGQMIIARFEKDHTPVVVKLPGFASVPGQKVNSSIKTKNWVTVKDPFTVSDCDCDGENRRDFLGS